MFELRPYQQEAVNAIWANLDKHCVASLPTGSGKTPVIAELIRRFLEYPGTHILLLTHKRELIRQNAAALGKHLPFNVEIGVFCAGLRSKQLKEVTIASVQSIVNAKELPPFEIIIVDEAHLISRQGESQYHLVFKRFPDARIIGLTATPFRMDSGMLHKGNDRLFEALVFEAKTGTLIDEGWLSPIRARAVSEHADLSEVHLRGGEYKPDEMIAAMDKAKLTASAVQDVLKHAKDRKSILVFCAGVEHARHVDQAFRVAGQTSVATVTESTTMYDRDEATERFRNKTLRILVNCSVYSTGFDAPNVDCIVILRATKSAGLYIQIVGRGLRKAEGKEDCLLLDYGGNIEEHGPLDMITADSVTKGKGAAPVRTCPECGTIQFAGLKACEHCGFLFPRESRDMVKHGAQASDLDPIKPHTSITEYRVNNVMYDRHKGRDGKKDTIKVTYQVGLARYISEWICPEHDGFAKSKAASWFARRGVVPAPKTVTDALAISDTLLVPTKITVKEGSKWPEIIGYAGWRKNEGENVVDEEMPF